MRISRLRPLLSYVKPTTQFDARPSIAYTSRTYCTVESSNVHSFEQKGIKMMGMSSATCYRGSCFSSFSSNRLLVNKGFQGGLSVASISHLSNRRLFSSASEATASGASGVGVGGDDWVEKLKEMWQSTVEAVKYTGEKAKEASDEAAPHVQQLLDAHPYLRDVIVPVGGTLAGTILAWSLLPRLFKRFHKYSVEGLGVLLSGSTLWGPVPHENSFWGALEVPVRYNIMFMALLEIGQMVAPTVITSQYVAQAWRGAVVVSLVWFLHRWETNVISRTLVGKTLERGQRDQLLTLDKISSVGLFIIGSMALAEACGMSVQSILTVGCIGGVATAFASKDILGNVRGLSVQTSQPFSIGDTIKAGSVEGLVVAMGLTTTSLLTAETFLVVVQNSLLSSQVIVIKSRARWRSIVKTIPLRIDDIGKIPQISDAIKSMLKSNSNVFLEREMLKSNSNVFLEREAPFYFLSHIERSYAWLTLGCNLKQMNKDAEQYILLEAVRIIKKYGAMLGSMQEDKLN